MPQGPPEASEDPRCRPAARRNHPAPAPRRVRTSSLRPGRRSAATTSLPPPRTAAGTADRGSRSTARCGLPRGRACRGGALSSVVDRTAGYQHHIAHREGGRLRQRQPVVLGEDQRVGSAAQPGPSGPAQPEAEDGREVERVADGPHPVRSAHGSRHGAILPSAEVGDATIRLTAGGTHDNRQVRPRARRRRRAGARRGRRVLPRPGRLQHHRSPATASKPSSSPAPRIRP